MIPFTPIAHLFTYSQNVLLRLFRKRLESVAQHKAQLLSGSNVAPVDRQSRSSVQSVQSINIQYGTNVFIGAATVRGDSVEITEGKISTYDCSRIGSSLAKIKL